MKKIVAPIFVAVMTVGLMGQAGPAGCNDPDYLPSIEQIDFYLPSELRTCKYAPPSPGANATRRQTARYIVKLYDAYKDCKGNNQKIDALYEQYRGKIDKLRAKYK